MLDNFRAISVTWDHSTNTIYNNIRTASEDANGRKLVVQVVNGHQLEDLTSVDLRLYWEFDEHKGFDDFELIDEDNGIYEIHFSTDMVSHVGAHKAWLHLVDAEGTVTSEPFTVTVFEGVDADTIQDSNEFSALSNALVAISDLETNYAPRLNSVENNKADKATVNSEVSRLDQKDADLTAQLAQTVSKLKPVQLKPIQLKPLIAFTIDDGVIQDLDIFDVAQQYNIPFTTAIISNRVGTSGYLSQQQIKTMEDAGWEVTSHSKSHVALPDLSEEQLEIEVRDSKQDLLEMGFNVKSMSLPFGRTSEQVRNVVAKHYRSMRVSASANTGDDLNYPPIDTFGINSVTLGDSSGTDNAIDSESGLMVDTLPYWKYLVDKAKESNSLLTFISHAEPLKLRLEELKQLFVYIQSLGIETVTLDKALDTFQNQVDTQKMKVGADGTVSGEYGKIRQAPYNTILGDTNIKDIDRELITYNTVTEIAGQNSGLPNQTGGTSLVVNPDNRPDRSFQLLKSQGIDGGLFLKEFDQGGSASHYRQLDTVYVHPANSLKSNHTRSDLKKRRINYCAIYTSGASGYPREEAGLLIADDLIEGYFNETYITITGNKYTRNNIGDAWSTVLDVTPLSLNSKTPNSPIATYPNGISYTQISVGGASGFPEGKAGMLETHKITVNGYNFQYYHIYNETQTYKRIVRNDGTWTDFVLV